MDNKTQLQLQEALKTIKHLERVVHQLVLRVSVLEKNNAKLKSTVIKHSSDISAIERRNGS